MKCICEKNRHYFILFYCFIYSTECICKQTTITASIYFLIFIFFGWFITTTTLFSLLIHKMYVILFQPICYVNQVNNWILIYLERVQHILFYPIILLWIIHNNPSAFTPFVNFIRSPEILYVKILLWIALNNRYFVLFYQFWF